MYMNAITVNYAEVGDDHLPISFGFGSKTSFAGETVYNSTITEISDTSCIILQGQKLEPQNIIMSSSPAVNRLLSGFTPGPTSWIKHIIPNINNKDTTYIFYNSSEGYYYKMVENDQGKPVQEKYAPYARILSAANNDKYPYCEAKIETPVELQISDGKVNAIINNKSVQIAEMESSLVIELENADGTLNRQTIKQNEYSINTSIYNLNGIVWTRDDKTVTSWLLDNNKIVKSDMSVSRWTKTIKLLAGNNVVTIPRNKSTIKVIFTFTNTYMPSFEWGGAYHNGLENSTMSGNTLTIPDVRQGTTSINLTTFYTDSETKWFNPSSINPSSGSGTFSVEVNILTPSATDKISFTGWIDGKLEQGKIISCNHGILPQAYTIDKMNTKNLSRVDITNETPNAISGLLTYDQTNKQFKRHRQITQINKSNTSTRTTTIDDDNKNPGTTSTDIYLYASNNNVSQTFNVTAHYTNIPAVVSVTNPSDTAVASNNQVVLFEGAYYVADINMENLVESLVSGVTVNAKKEVIKSEARGWQTTVKQTYYKVTITPAEPEKSTEPTYNYTLESEVTITISGNGDQVSSVNSSDSNLTVKFTSSIEKTALKIIITYTVSDGFSLSMNETITTLNNTVSIPENNRNQKITYKFFN